MIDATVVRPLKRGASVRVVRAGDDGWKEIEFSGLDGKVGRGFVFGQFLAPAVSTPEAPAAKSLSLDEINLRGVPPSPAAVSPPVPITPDAGVSITVRCNNSIGYVAPDGVEWDGSTTTNLREGAVIGSAVPYTQPSDKQRFYKGRFGGRTVFIKESDIEGANCSGERPRPPPPAKRCAPGQIPNFLTGICGPALICIDAPGYSKCW